VAYVDQVDDDVEEVLTIALHTMRSGDRGVTKFWGRMTSDNRVEGGGKTLV